MLVKGATGNNRCLSIRLHFYVRLSCSAMLKTRKQSLGVFETVGLANSWNGMDCGCGSVTLWLVWSSISCVHIDLGVWLPVWQWLRYHQANGNYTGSGFWHHWTNDQSNLSQIEEKVWFALVKILLTLKQMGIYFFQNVISFLMLLTTNSTWWNQIGPMQ